MVSCDVICGADEKRCGVPYPTSIVFDMSEQFFTIAVPSDKKINPSLKNICPEVRFSDRTGLMFSCIWRYTYIKCGKYIPVCIIKFISHKLIASVSIFCPNSSKSLNVSSDIKTLTFSVTNIVKFELTTKLWTFFLCHTKHPIQGYWIFTVTLSICLNY